MCNLPIFRFCATGALASRVPQLAVSLFLLVILQACAAPAPVAWTSPQPALAGDERYRASSETPPTGFATVFFVDNHVNEYFRFVEISGQRIGEWDVGVMRVDLLPGSYEVTLGDTDGRAKVERWAPTRLSVAAGEVHYLSRLWKKTGQSSPKFRSDLGIRTRADIEGLVFLKPEVDTRRLIPNEQKAAYDDCQLSFDGQACVELLESPIGPLLAPDVREQAQVAAAELRRQQAKAKALEESLPPAVRRDKLMLQVTDLLKAKQYSESLPVFEKLAALKIPLDADFDYFRGEAYLRSGQAREALTLLYKYVRERGSAARYYQQALTLINEAEALG